MLRNSLLFLLFWMLISCSKNERPEIDWQGHRGARGAMPENTVPAFLYALQNGMNTLEMDVVISKDSQIVVSHEPFFNEEICDFQGDINNLYKLEYSDIQSVDCGSKGNPRFPKQKKQPIRKPTLARVVDVAKSFAKTKDDWTIFYNVEIKSRPKWDAEFHPPVNEYCELVVKEIQELKISERTTIQSFDTRALQFLHQNYPDIRLALLVDEKEDFRTKLKTLGFLPQILSPNYKLVNEEMMTFCREKDMKVIPWTVNDANTAEKLVNVMGVNGIITDYPSIKKEVKIK